MKKIIIFSATTFLIINCFILKIYAQNEVNTFSDDRDGKTYKTVKINEQEWFAENISFNTDSGSWAYDNNEENINVYGRLYNWETAKAVCPVGWHLPDNEEWTLLIDYFGGENIAGKKLKSKSQLWRLSDTTVVNLSEFNAIPAGIRYVNNDIFFTLGDRANFWSNSSYDDKFAWGYYIDYNSDKIYKNHYELTLGFSVRCIKNN